MAGYGRPWGGASARLWRPRTISAMWESDSGSDGVGHIDKVKGGLFEHERLGDLAAEDAEETDEVQEEGSGSGYRASGLGMYTSMVVEEEQIGHEGAPPQKAPRRFKPELVERCRRRRRNDKPGPGMLPIDSTLR